MKSVAVLMIFICETFAMPYNFNFNPGSNVGYGGGVSFTANLKPFDTQNPIDYAFGVAFGYGMDVAGHKLSDTFATNGAMGRALGRSYGFGGAMDGFAYGGGNTDTLLTGTPGLSNAYTNNIAFSNQIGNGAGSGNAIGRVVGFAK
ncbi:uncharacterized protein LOC129596170 [Paramacrobiotus metropolitanus]|uniref:uncharacterized protein LOC129596170 n=1 Tax=Paramacrobiotus metropolitanus TaxID=2943436 RepID=UPI002445A790|nr:uncharacterized protein LOC129596170 [Paramacrobiotus metropolitanus]